MICLVQLCNINGRLVLSAPAKGHSKPVSYPGGIQQMFIRGGSDPKSNPLPFYKPFFPNKVQLLYTFYWQMVYPFHIPCLELGIPFNCCECTVFLNRNQWKKTERFLDFLKPQNLCVSPFGPFYRPKWQISLPFHMLQLVKSLRYPFIYMKTEKGTPFGRSLPV